MTAQPSKKSKTYVVEHLDPELGPWSTLEYLAIAQESLEAGSNFCLSSIAADLSVPSEILSTNGIVLEHRGVEEIYNGCKDRVCLLDPAATSELSPEDCAHFDIFLYGGILGTANPPKLHRHARLTPTQATIRLEVRR